MTFWKHSEADLEFYLQELLQIRLVSIYIYTLCFTFGTKVIDKTTIQHPITYRGSITDTDTNLAIYQWNLEFFISNWSLVHSWKVCDIFFTKKILDQDLSKKKTKTLGKWHFQSCISILNFSVFNRISKIRGTIKYTLYCKDYLEVNS